MKKFLSIILIIGLVLSFSGLTKVESVIADDEPETFALEKPIHVTVVDELGNPVEGAKVVVKDAAGNIYEDEELMEEVFITFLASGIYTLELSEIPEGYIADVREKTVEVTLAEGEEVNNIKGKTIVAPYPDYSDLCSHNPSRMEIYKIVDGDKDIPGYCFNQNYDAPDIDDPNCTYTRLLGTPWLLGFIAQNEREGLSSSELFHHVLSMIYHRDEIKAKYELDDFLTDYILNMAIKNLTDGDMDSFKTYDNDGNPMLIRDENGRPLLNDKGHYQFYPGGTTLGSIVAHAKNDHKTDPNYQFPENVKNAWKEFVTLTDHPSDYFLYIYVPDNFVTKEYGIASGNFTVDNHYDNLYYADAYQALMSTFTVTPIKEQFVLRQVRDIIITKVWDDNDNEDQARPTPREFQPSIHLLANGEDVTSTYSENMSVVDNGDGTFTVVFVNLPELDEDKEEITYTIREDSIPNYTADKDTVGNGETITNTYTPPETVDITVEKTWSDNNDKEGKRPASITVNLLADGDNIQTVEIKPDEQGNWSYTFTELPKYQDDGVTEIAYTVTEESVADYTTTIDGFKITNTLKTHPPTGDTLGLKTWIFVLAAAFVAVAVILILWRKRDHAK